jgi:8-oxo-dGTP diphosphatase
LGVFILLKPLYLQCNDDQYPHRGISHTRPNARALIQNDQGLFAFNHIYALDKFGQRDYLETPGGGLNDQESPEQAILREVEEELGVVSQIITKIGIVEDFYNLIQRQNLNHYFYLKVTGNGLKQWTAQEHVLIRKQLWLTLDEAIRWYRQLPSTGISQLVKQRELPVLNWLKGYLNSAQIK